MSGLWLVLEGPDCSGKTTAHQALATLFSNQRDCKVHATRHPGSTAYGKVIRDLVMHRGEEEHLTIDRLSEQLLMLTDHLSFRNEILTPVLQRGEVVLSDRCNLISGVVYGLANGVDFKHLDKIITMAETPKVDRLYLLQCSWDSLVQRAIAKNGRDRFEARGSGFLRHVHDLYNEMLIQATGELLVLLNRIVGLENIKIIDANRPQQEVVMEIFRDMKESLLWRLPPTG